MRDLKLTELAILQAVTHEAIIFCMPGKKQNLARDTQW